ncbi:hypothetical protein NA57DRAFT_78275 [Rhizodiscina lignyota]|uniref:Uncharacterized protein n=1 Tax=Rhizodiscina lignyota TaxID=1504668 RepID=A0A9P4IDR0_9PEZI|nr:hypothetical protein NA57DRAFT_78275 [Rhizodiscina lignyota]
MADSQGAGEFTIPTITEQHLRDFHAPNDPTLLPTRFFCTEEEIEELHEQFPHAHPPWIFTEKLNELLEFDDYGLGYYPDGKKRTLTDDQIVIFRHSEVNRILREKRRLVEGVEAPDADQTATTYPAAAKTTDAQAGAEPHGTKREFQEDEESESEEASELSEEGTIDFKDTTAKEEWEAVREAKRRRQVFKSKDKNEDFTPRRIAREQDNIKAEDIEMDYG